MQPRLVPKLLLVFGCVLWMGVDVCAQPSPATAPTLQQGAAGDLIRDTGLKIRVREDKNGDLIAVPDFTVESYLEMVDAQRALKDRRGTLPKFVFSGPITLDGRVALGKQTALLRVSFRIQLTARNALDEETWTAIPLRLDNAYLDIGAIEYDEEGEMYIARVGESYVCWIRAPANSHHTIHVPIRLPVRQTGSQYSLDVVLPNMTTTMKLIVEGKAIDAFSPARRSNVSLETHSDGTEITVESGGGELDLAWQPRGQVAPNALEATCASTVHVHGNHIWSEARLKVRSRAEPIDSFIVRLPDKMELTSRSDEDFQISVLPARQDGAPQQVLVKRLAGPTRQLIDVKLEATLPRSDEDQQRRTVELSGFSVQDSIREWGSVDITLNGNWSPTWRGGQFVQRVAVADEPAIQQAVAARFIYDRQPFFLRVDLRPKQTQISLDATYIVDVSEDSTLLDARVAYSTNGAKDDSITFKMAGWTVDSVTPRESLAEPFTVDDEGNLILTIADDATELDLRIRAHRLDPGGSTDLTLDLPRPNNPALLPNATLIVIAGDNVELIPESTSLKWLTQETRVPSLELPKRATAPLVFREELSSENEEAARFVARRNIRPRETTVTVSSDANLEGDSVTVRQSLLANVAYAPLSELEVSVPTSVIASGTLSISSGGESLPFRELSSIDPKVDLPASDAVASESSDTKNDDESPRTSIVIELPAPIIGEIQIDVEFQLKDIISTDGSRISLVQPIGAEVTAQVINTLTVRSSDNTVITLADELWTIAADAEVSANDQHQFQIQATGVTTSALVQTSIVERRTNGSTSIPRIWIQSWLSLTGRCDRVCFQLRSDQEMVRFKLPSFAGREEIIVLVNGESPLKLVDHGDLSMTVTLTDEQVGRQISLELWYYLYEQTRDSQFDVALPVIVDADRAGRVYWQVVLPRNEHLAWLPAKLTAELVWQRDQWYWGRSGRLEQEAIEELVGASAQDSVSPNSNRYLFSSTGSIESVEFVKVNRRTLMFAGSGVMLAVILPFLYLPRLRRPPVLFVVGVVLFVSAVTYPEHAAVVGQAGAIGLGLGIVACVLHRLLSSGPTVPIPRRESVYVPPDSKASGTLARQVVDGSSRATTATAPAHLQVARAEGES